jgi:hypothetical protein
VNGSGRCWNAYRLPRIGPYPLLDYRASVKPGDVWEGQAPPNRYKEWFSWSVIVATTSAAGLVCQVPVIDTNKVDVQVSTWRPLHGRLPTIALQLKATSSPQFVGVPGALELAFRLKGEDYNGLLQPSTLPTYLVVVGVPELDRCWVRQRSSMVALSAGAWWLEVRGEPTEQETITVHLPVEQRFNSAALREMLAVA